MAYRCEQARLKKLKFGDAMEVTCDLGTICGRLGKR
ncbi:hypothetical protein BJ998_004998 [Kutzneria kofuensis]|uniref:Uncharacterized protein n=1 Tax=Kutzneria kofuensis TaxID=103725 RepID=A0A7W9KJW6_9PSEU|nr:hypothetical protein [Kutzneria kofuensis]